jgi:drug/metabolite transporter (DMT)-like permease
LENSGTKSQFISEGVKHMLFSAFAFSMMNVFVKQLPDLPAMEIVFFRCVVSVAACLYALRSFKESLLGNRLALLIARGTTGTFALYCFFITIQNIPLASAVTISYLSPIFTTLIAVFFLREKVTPMQVLFYGIAFGGVVIIKGFDPSLPYFFLMTAVLAALFSGISYNLVRTLSAKEHPLVIVLHFQIVGVVVGLIFTIIQWRLPHGIEWLYLLLTGICTQLGQVYLTRSLQSSRVAEVSIVAYTGIIYALIFGWFVFGESVSLATSAGIALVILGVVLSVIFSKRRNAISQIADYNENEIV